MSYRRAVPRRAVGIGGLFFSEPARHGGIRRRRQDRSLGVLPGGGLAVISFPEFSSVFAGFSDLAPGTALVLNNALGQLFLGGTRDFRNQKGRFIDDKSQKAFAVG